MVQHSLIAELNSVYGVLLGISTVVTALLTYFARRASAGSKNETSPSFRKFRNTYLVVFWIAMAGDWLQGPYVYALYSSYGLAQADIAALFVAGFGSSMIFGTFVGGVADRIGRKKCALIYCAVYMVSCVTKHFPAYNSLMLGRVLGGIATSLLFSVFESWMVAEHNARSFDGAWMGDTFSLAFFGNGIIAIVAGIVAQFGADAMPLTQLQPSVGLWGGGYTVPFDMSLLVLGVCAFVIMDRWSENYGSSSAASSGLSLQALKAGCATICAKREVLLCGIIASSFEGAMYSFVFIWTPVLSKGDAALPHGLVFAAFMVCCMAGSQIFGLSSGAGLSLQARLSVVFAVGAAALAVPAVTDAHIPSMVAFLVFEVCVGMYWPCVGTLKSQLVPEENRAAVYTLFRVPLNAIVIGVLLTDMTTFTIFKVCTALLLLATGAALMLTVNPPASTRTQEHAPLSTVDEDAAEMA